MTGKQIEVHKFILKMEIMELRRAFLMILLTASSITFAQSPYEIDAIQRVADNFSSSYIKGDYTAMANFYTDDAVLMSPGQDMIYGKDAIYKFWSRDPTYHQTFHRSKSDKLEIIGNLAIDNGYWYSKAITKGKEGDLYSGKYLIIWKKNDKGEWRMYHDIWNNRAKGWEEKEKP